MYPFFDVMKIKDKLLFREKVTGIIGYVPNKVKKKIHYKSSLQLIRLREKEEDRQRK